MPYEHPGCYVEWLCAWAADGPPPTPLRRLELELHVRQCPLCQHLCACLLRSSAPDLAARCLARLDRRLTPAAARPFFGELYTARRAGYSLTEFQAWLWDWVARHPDARAEYVLTSAIVECEAGSTNKGIT